MFYIKKIYLLLFLGSFAFVSAMDDHQLMKDQLKQIGSSSDNINMCYWGMRCVDSGLSAYLTYSLYQVAVESGGLATGTGLLSYCYVATTGLRTIVSLAEAVNCMRARKVLTQLINDDESLDLSTLSRYVYKKRPEFLSHVMFGLSVLRTASNAPTLFSENWMEFLWNTGIDITGEFVRGLHELHESEVQQLKKAV